MSRYKYFHNPIKYMQKIIDALKQESTWRGIIAIVTALGVVISPDLATHIIAVGLALIGTINVAKKD